MSQTRSRDLEGGDDPGPVDGHRDRPQSRSDQPWQPSEGESDYCDNSWPLYSMYSKITEEEDDKMIERCHKDADGILIFSGLFSATIAALLTVSIPDLKPNSQDTSAFYLKNLYQLQVVGDPNISHPSIPSTFAEPPAFSPPKYVVMVNGFWFASLAFSLSAAVGATMTRKWAVKHIKRTRWPWDTPAKRARTRAIFAKDTPGLYTIWGMDSLHIHLNFSILEFVAGASIYLFNVNRTVFNSMLWVLVYLAIAYVGFGLFKSSMGKKEARKIASKPSSKVDALILERLLFTLDKDHDLEEFFDAIPGFCDSKLSDLPLSFRVQTELKQVLDCFLDRTFSSSLVSESARTGRLVTCLNAAHAALRPSAVSGILDNIFNGSWDEALQSVEIGHALRLWDHSRDHDLNVRRIVARIIPRVRKRDDRWTTLVKEAFGVSDYVLRDYLSHGDSVLLSIVIHISRQANRAGPCQWTSGILSSLSEFDIHDTLPGLQHDFCALWNEISQEARNQGSFSTPALILWEIRHLYITLHQDTDAAPTTFSASTPSLHFILDQPLSYPLCDITSHRPDSTTCIPVPLPTQLGDSPDSSPHQPTLDRSAALRLAEETHIATGLPSPPDPSITSQIGETSQAPTATFPVLSVSPPPDGFPEGGVTAAQLDSTSATTRTHRTHPPRPLEIDEQKGSATSFVAPRADVSGVLTNVPTPLVPASVTYDASPASIPGSLLPYTSTNFFAPDSLPPHVLPFPNAELLSLLSGMSPKSPPDNDAQTFLRPRRLVNDENVYLANTVLQLVVYCSPFRELFSDLGRLLGQRKAGVTDGGATPLVDATVAFLDETTYKEMSPRTQQFLQLDAGSKARDDEDGNEEDDSMQSTYVYDAMKEKRQFNIMEDNQHRDAAVFFSLYLDALDEELVALRSSFNTHNPASTLKGEGLEEENQLGKGQSEVEERGCTTSSVKSPISRIFGGRTRTTLRAPNQPDTVTAKEWRLLKLDIQPDSVHTIQDLLVHITQPKPLQVGQSSSIEASQQVHFEALPPVLVLHLERFLYDETADGIVKICKPVRLAPQLEFSLGVMVPIAGKPAELVNYKLCGVLYHHGESASGGRYTIDVLHQNGDSGSGEAWLHIDDEGVRAVRHEDVLGDHDSEQVDDRCAYMLFYCRTAPA